MNVVFVASEVVPFAKTGGLGDVAGALPRALEKQGHTVAVFVPGYRRVWSAGVEIARTDLTLQIPIGARTVEGHVHESRLPGSKVRVYLIDQPRYFDRDGLYGVATAKITRTTASASFSSIAPSWKRSRPWACGPTSSIAMTGKPV